jgi:hypothetical protein
MGQTTHRRRGAAAAAILAVAITGCGAAHKQSDQQRITQTLRSYLRAQAAGDGQTACALLTAEAQNQLITLVVKGSNGLITTRPSCEEAVGLVRAVAGQKLIGALSSAQISSVQVSGTQASAEVVVDSQPAERVSLVNSGGAWKVAGVPGLSG